MPVVTLFDGMLLSISTSTAADIAALPLSNSRYPMPVDQVVRKIVGDRLALAGTYLSAGDRLLREGHFRSAISRHYYAMYHAARAVAFGHYKGDDHERHSKLPRALPNSLDRIEELRNDLTEARFLRNQADYDPYPSVESEWDADARKLSSVAAAFCSYCDEYAQLNGLI